MKCTHCNGTGKCKEAQLKFKNYEAWYECELCESSAPVKYGGFFEYPSFSVRRKAKKQALYCQACHGKGS